MTAMTHTPENPDTGAMCDRLADFEGRLSRRTKVPPERLKALVARTDDDLRAEAQMVNSVLKRFAEAVADSLEHPGRIDDFLRSLDLRAISRDHDWRTIFSTLRGRDTEEADFKRAAIVKYLQYLGFRKRLVDYVRARRQGLEETDGYIDITLLPGGRGVGEPAPGTGPEQFVRLPLGETLEFTVEDGERLDVMLGPHLFHLFGARPPCLFDRNGVAALLRPGRNMVGRHPESDVAVDPNFGHVSRAHLVIEWAPPRIVRVIDVSTRGTWMRRSTLGRARSLPLAD